MRKTRERARARKPSIREAPTQPGGPSRAQQRIKKPLYLLLGKKTRCASTERKTLRRRDPTAPPRAERRPPSAAAVRRRGRRGTEGTLTCGDGRRAARGGRADPIRSGGGGGRKETGWTREVVTNKLLSSLRSDPATAHAELGRAPAHL
jgi:hypothetical protein